MRSDDVFLRKLPALAFCAALALWSWQAVRAADDKGANGPSPIPVADVHRSSPVDFEREVLPVLSTSCLACHNKTKAKAKLVLETPGDIRKGGESGPAVIIGKGSESLLLRAAAHAPDVDSPMPPPHNAANAPDLSPAQLGLIRLWIDQGATGEVHAGGAPMTWVTLAPSVQPIYAVAVSGDGQLAACGRGNRIDVYHLPTARLVAHLIDPKLGTSARDAAHRDLVESLAFSPDGMTLASGSYREIKIWRRPMPAKRFDLAGLGGSSLCAAVRPNGKLIAVGDSDGLIRLFDALDGKLAGTLMGCEGPATAVNFSADGNRLVSYSADGTLRVWDVPHQALLCKADVPSELRAVVWLERGKRIAGGGADGIIRLWRLPDAVDDELRQCGEFKGHEGGINALAPFPSIDARMLSGGEDGFLRIWNVDSEQLVREVKQGSAVISAAISGDGKRFASTGLDNTVKLWNAADAKLIAETKGDPALLDRSVKAGRAVALAADEIAYSKARVADSQAERKTQSDRLQKANDGLAAAAKDVDARRHAMETARSARDAVEIEIAARKRSSEAVAQAGEHLKSLKALIDSGHSGDGSKAQDEAEIAKVADAIKKATDGLAAMNLEARRKAAEAALAQSNTELEKAISAKSGAEQEAVSAGQSVQGATASLGRATEASKSAEAARIERQIELAAAKHAFADSVKPFRSVAFSSDGSTLAAAGDNGVILTLNSEKGAPGEVIAERNGPIGSVEFAGANSLIALGQGGRGAAKWDLSSPWSLARTIGSADGASPIADRVTSLDFSPKQTMLASGGGIPSRSGEVKLWEPGSGKLLGSFDDVHVDTVTSVRFSPDGRRLACGSTDRFVRVIDLETGKVVQALEGHQHHVLGVAWRRDGHTIASAGADNTLRFWNADTGERDGVVNAFDKEVTSVCFVGDGDLALVTCGDGKVKTFHDGGAEDRTFSAAGDFVYASAVTPDGQIIAAGGQDGILRAWSTSTGRPIASFAPESRGTRLPASGR